MLRRYSKLPSPPFKFYAGLGAAYLAYKAYRNRRFIGHTLPVAAGMYVKRKMDAYPSPSKSPKKAWMTVVKPLKKPATRFTPSTRVVSTSGRGTQTLALPPKLLRSRVITWRKKSLRIRRKRRVKRSKVFGNLIKDCYNKGAVCRQEHGGLYEDPFCIILGHSVPSRLVRRAFFMSVIKKTLDKAGITMESPETAINLVTAGDIFYMYYRTVPQTSNAIGVISWTMTGGASLSLITTKMVEAYQASAAYTYENVQWENALFYANGSNDLASVRVSLIGATCAYYFDSCLKIQNRTQDSPTNTQADDLVAQHIEGKSYFGRGNYVQNRARLADGSATQEGIVGDENGLIFTSSVANPDDQLKEPAPKSQFKNCVSTHSVHFNPGEVKKSFLRYKIELPINEFFKLLVRCYQNPLVFNQYQIVKQAKFRFFMLEKQIETVYNTSPATPVKCSWQTDCTVGCVIYPKNNTYLSRENIVDRSIPSI